MSSRIWLLIITICFLFPGQKSFSQIILYGRVYDCEYLPVVNALVELIDQADSGRVISSMTDAQGNYDIFIYDNGIDNNSIKNPGALYLYQNFPNPFNPATRICYELPQPADIRVEIYNVLGQKIKTLYDGFQTQLFNLVMWDGTDDNDRGVAAGIYIYSLVTNEQRINRKMLLLDGHAGQSAGVAISVENKNLSNPGRMNKTASNIYLLRVSAPDIVTWKRQDVEITDQLEYDIMVFRKSTVADIDGNIYQTVLIGDQWWMAENLRVLYYNNGEPIPNITDNAQWMDQMSGAWCYYDNNPAYAADYGVLYNWFTIHDSRGFGPTGWHVPADEEWDILVNYLGGMEIAGGKMKEAGTERWTSPNEGASNESGLTVRPGGIRYAHDGTFTSLGSMAYFWTGSQNTGLGAWNRFTSYMYADINRYYSNEKCGYAVRLIKDIIPDPPYLYSPYNNETEISTSPLLRWGNSTGAFSYHLQVADNINFTTIFIDLNDFEDTSYQLTGLTQGATYYWRVSAANSAGTSPWSETYCFTTAMPDSGTVTDIDGNTYKTIKIGKQWWMAENLRVAHYRNGEAIPNITDNNQWKEQVAGAYCYYQNDSNNADDYGALYNWYALNETRNLAPTGWHIPTLIEWNILIDFLGGESVAGGKLKETGTEHWNSPNTGATNESGFTGRPGGYRNGFTSNFDELGQNACYWAATEYNNEDARSYILMFDQSVLHLSSNSKRTGFSIRCIRD
ncbi:MAG TPA: FISUMP domain-containing protein [bacterium]|nr:FISUMP domain-containing protein [bacterium]HPN44065.1 FISUMP domain-containing protein [bacterium]